MNSSVGHGKVKWTVRWNDVEKIESVHDNKLQANISLPEYFLKKMYRTLFLYRLKTNTKNAT